MIFKTEIGQIQEVNRKIRSKTEYATKYVFRERGITGLMHKHECIYAVPSNELLMCAQY